MQSYDHRRLTEFRVHNSVSMSSESIEYNKPRPDSSTTTTTITTTTTTTTTTIRCCSTLLLICILLLAVGLLLSSSALAMSSSLLLTTLGYHCTNAAGWFWHDWRYRLNHILTRYFKVHYWRQTTTCVTRQRSACAAFCTMQWPL